jgi:tight adherence protein C
MSAFIDTLAALLTVRVGPLVFPPIETTILVLAFAVASLSAFRLWRIGERERREPRLAALLIGPAGQAATARPKWYSRFGASVAMGLGRTQQQRLLDTLADAGIRRQGALATFVAIKVCGAFAMFAALAWLLQVRPGLIPGSAVVQGLLQSVLIVAAVFLGWLAPDIVLTRMAARRRLRIEQGMPDALDLLVVCAEAGLSLDQAIDQVSRDLRLSHPEIAEEFAITAAEMRVGSDRGSALENMVRRTHLESLRSITATLAQAIRFGTPLAESLRILAAEMRTARILRIEERAARLPVLLTLPLMAFILPALFITIGTPVALRIYDFFSTLHIGRAIL